MATELPPVDVTDSPELLRLAEEVQRSGIGRVLKNGDQELALLTPVAPSSTTPRPRRRQSASVERDAILDIIGIGASAEPTDIARHKREYLAEAYAPKP